jgi:hypothetical protein
MRLEHLIPAERDLPPGRLQQRKEHLVREVVASSGGRERRRRRWLFGALVPAAILLLGATGIATYALTRSATEFDGIGCFEQASVDGNISVVSPDGQDPLIICAEILSQTPGLAVDGPEDLAACVLESGVAAVFPRTGPETCQSLGLAKLDADYAERSKRFAELRNALLAAVDFKCLGEQEARAAATQVLAQLGFTGWRVDVNAPSDGTELPRAVTIIEEEGKTVRLVMLGGDGLDCETVG